MILQEINSKNFSRSWIFCLWMHKDWRKIEESWFSLKIIVDNNRSKMIFGNMIGVAFYSVST